MKKIFNLSILKFSIIIISSSCQINKFKNEMQSEQQNLEIADNKNKEQNVIKTQENNKQDIQQNLNNKTELTNDEKKIDELSKVKPKSNPTSNINSKSNINLNVKQKDEPIIVTNKSDYNTIDGESKDIIELQENINNIKEPELEYDQKILHIMNNEDENIEEEKDADMNDAVYTNAKIKQNDGATEQFLNKNDNESKKGNCISRCCKYIFCYLCLCKCLCCCYSKKPKIKELDNYNKIKSSNKDSKNTHSKVR